MHSIKQWVSAFSPLQLEQANFSAKGHVKAPLWKRSFSRVHDLQNFSLSQVAFLSLADMSWNLMQHESQGRALNLWSLCGVEHNGQLNFS